MKKRLIIYSAVTLIALLMFLFVPELNIGGPKPAISIYHELHSASFVKPVLVRLIVLISVFFISILFLFGLGEKGNDENKDKSKGKGKN